MSTELDHHNATLSGFAAIKHQKPRRPLRDPPSHTHTHTHPPLRKYFARTTGPSHPFVSSSLCPLAQSLPQSVTATAENVQSRCESNDMTCLSFTQSSTCPHMPGPSCKACHARKCLCPRVRRRTPGQFFGSGTSRLLREQSWHRNATEAQRCQVKTQEAHAANQRFLSGFPTVVVVDTTRHKLA